jgi:hypothetical protein
MTEIPLPENWNFDVKEFSDWADNNLLGTWDFKTTYSLFNPAMIFTNEEDAVAFKLKFL